ncbi:hypothetical protein HCUR_01549 [Holospora curviuscula]|uniref:Uncharacterized protein n=1 Tax=Holospora curviuscula TaxID=1082868 RepID=A0A2S5R6R0_9PROT|nr:hypothetical protein HCUR_01549 [Holospora curviuscula]
MAYLEKSPRICHRRTAILGREGVVRGFMMGGKKHKRGSIMNNAFFHKRKDRQPMGESAGHVFLD